VSDRDWPWHRVILKRRRGLGSGSYVSRRLALARHSSSWPPVPEPIEVQDPLPPYSSSRVFGE
jgi:hypothetical protein